MERPEETSDSIGPGELDHGLAFAYGGPAEPMAQASVLDRIAAQAGANLRISLRDVAAASTTPILRPLGPEEPRHTGRYVIHGELGRGGVGAVHRGHDQDLGRDVAIKFLRARHKDDPSILRRFVEEAQIGGQLQHPGIVPVYDLGMSKGQPFFAMKLVKGETLAKRLAERESPASDRHAFLAIFEDVCQTIAYAHARGVVHRDLKPANVMIGAFGEVQVVDWGMGKVLPQGGNADERLAEERSSRISVIETVRSQDQGSRSVVGSVMGTPAYMPPEQARGDVEAMDERSDVFSLGAILCEILTGAPPYTGEREKLIERAAAADLKDAAKRLDASRAEPELVELTRRCLAPAPESRPRNADAVARVIHEHLAATEARVHDARVEAAEAKVRAASLRRQARLGLALITAIAAGLALSLWFWRDASQQRGLAERRAEQAGVEAARARAVRDLIDELLSGGRPYSRGRATTVASVLADFDHRLGRELEVQPEVEVFLRLSMARAYLGASETVEAAAHVGRARDLAERLASSSPDLDVQLLSTEGLLHFVKRDFPRAAALFREALDLSSGQPGDGPARVRTLTLLVQALARQMAITPAREALAEAQALADSLGDEVAQLQVEAASADIDKATGEAASQERRQRRIIEWRVELGLPVQPADQHNLALALQRQGRLDEAEAACQLSIQQHCEMLGEDTPALANSYALLASLHYNRGDLEQARRLGEQALDMARASETVDVGHILSLLCNVARYQGDHEAAIRWGRENLDFSLRLYGEEHRQTALACNNLGLAHRDAGDLDEAEAFLRRTLEIVRRTEMYASEGTLLTNVGIWLAETGEVAEGEALCRDALASIKSNCGEDHPMVAHAWRGLGLVLQSTRPEEAVTCLRSALAIMRDSAPDHPVRGQIASELAQTLRQQGHPEECVDLLQESLRSRTRYGVGSRTVVDELRALVDVSLEVGRAEATEWAAQQLLAADPSRDRWLAVLARALIRQEKYGEAESFAREYLDLARSSVSDEQRVDAQSLLGTALVGEGDLEQAEPLLLQTHESLEQNWPAWPRTLTSPDALRAEVRGALVELYRQLDEPEEVAYWTRQGDG